MGSIYSEDVAQAATAWIGYHEGDNNWNIFAKYLDEVGYYKPQEKQCIPWCAVFCNFCVWQAAYPKDRSDEAKMYDAQWFQYQPSYWNLSAGAKEYADYFKNADAWHTSDPEIGDMCFFQDDDGICHVGIVVDIEEYITTIEGNAGDQVQKKWYSYDEIGGRIAGFGRPRYDGYKNPANVDHAPVEEEPEAPTTDTELTIKTVSVESYLAVRSTPEVNLDNKIGELYDGARVYIFETHDGWARIGDNMWVYPEYLE